jgi:hypothetical protein
VGGSCKREVVDDGYGRSDGSWFVEWGGRRLIGIVEIGNMLVRFDGKAGVVEAG